MFFTALQRLEADFFRTLNQFIEPLVRLGFGAPMLLPIGAIVLETKGRRSGRQSNVPLMAMLVGDVVVVSTLRRHSHWLKNIAANPDVHYWLGGRKREATAHAIGLKVQIGDDLPERVNCLASTLKRNSSFFGTGFAILIPRDSRTARR
ncbi:MAG TPA: nitroreductase/quinone reductase family protein [Blastocatellia bacterium]|nr:nitroreductase/quinone reductase family protein [Blastocatellia bacterium]